MAGGPCAGLHHDDGLRLAPALGQHKSRSLGPNRGRRDDGVETQEIDTTTPLRNFILWLSTKKSVTDAIAKRGMKYGFARRFVAGETLEEAIAVAAELGRAGRRATLNQLGENVGSAEESRESCNTYLEMLRALDRAALDATISIKLTHLGLDLDFERCRSLTLEIAALAAALGRTLEIDMESSAYTDRTLDIFESAQRQHRNAALALQASLRRSESDLERLAVLEPKIRLVKGAYREPAALAFQKKSEVDANYRKLLDLLLRPRASGGFTAAIATHDPALLDFSRRTIERYSVAKSQYEFQMLFGIRRDLQEQVHAEGHPLRIYIPFGSAWCPYFMRRLAERPANVWFLLRSLFAERKRPSLGPAK